MNRVTLLAATALVSGMVAPGAARAQAAASEQVPSAAPAVATDREEAPAEVVVTGSRIVQPAYDGVIPGAQVSGEQIQRRTFTNALDALTDVPFVTAGANPYGGNGEGESLGQAYADLDFGERRHFGLTFNVSNVFDKLTAGTAVQSYVFTYPSTIVDNFGRRFTLSVDVKW
jgi:outer membrane receptor protein involved in Fe transport